MVLATKGRTKTGDDVNEAGMSRRHLDRALTTSLRRLQVDTIDLYQIHSWDPLTPIGETLSFLDAAVRKAPELDRLLSDLRLLAGVGGSSSPAGSEPTSSR